jgi:hypothetical protein
MKIYRLDDLENCLWLVEKQAITILESGKPVDVCCSVVKKHRTNQQNRYLFKLYEHLLEFYEQTGFMIDGLRFKFYTKDFLHEYLKARFDVGTTTKMTTEEFTNFVDKIQNEWMTQSGGEYEYFFPYEKLNEYEQHLMGGI